MKMTLDLPDDLIQQVELHAVHEGQKLEAAVVGLVRKGLAADSLAMRSHAGVDREMLERRKELTRKFVSGEWGVELDGYEAARKADRASARERAQAWRN